MYFYWLLDKLSSILTMAANMEEFVSRGQKYQTCLILSSRPREANFSPQFPRTREETAEQTASRGSLLSSFLKCAAGLTCQVDNLHLDNDIFFGILDDNLHDNDK